MLTPVYLVTAEPDSLACCACLPACCCSPYIDNATVTAPQLLAEELQQFGLSKFRDYQRVAASASLQLRVSETNSL